MDDTISEDKSNGTESVQFEAIPSFTVHQTLRVVIQGRTETTTETTEVVSMTSSDTSNEADDIVIKLSDTALTTEEDDDPLGYDWEALAEFPQP